MSAKDGCHPHRSQPSRGNQQTSQLRDPGAPIGCTGSVDVIERAELNRSLPKCDPQEAKSAKSRHSGRQGTVVGVKLNCPTTRYRMVDAEDYDGTNYCNKDTIKIEAGDTGRTN